MRNIATILLRKMKYSNLLLIFSLGFSQDLPPVPGFGHALEFDGSDDYVRIANGVAEPVDLTTNATWEFWINKHNSENVMFMRDFDVYNEDGYYINYYSNRFCFSQGTSNGLIQTESVENVLSDSIWQHIAIVKIDASVKLYLNGQEMEYSTTGNHSDINNSGESPLYLGGEPYNYHQMYSGLFDEFRIWNTARTEAEIVANMNEILDGDEPGLAGYWRFDEGSGAETADATANQNHGELVNSFTEPWPTSMHPIFTIPEDSLSFGHLFGHAWDIERPASFIYEHPQLGNLGILDPFAMTFDYVPVENMNYTNAPTSDGNISFMYAMTDGEGASYADTAFLKIMPINDAPIIVDTTIIPMFTPIMASQPHPNGDAVSDLTNQLLIHDPDFVTFTTDSISFNTVNGEGVGVTYIDQSIGVWEYCTDAECNTDDWIVLDPADNDCGLENGAVLLRNNDRIRFTPTDDLANGHAIIKFRIWDGTTDQPGMVCDASEFGGNTSISAEEVTAKIEIVSGPPVAGFGNAFMFDGSDDYISADNVCNQMTTNELTMECWVNPSWHNTQDGYMMAFNTSSHGNNNLIGWQNNTFIYYDDEVGTTSFFLADYHPGKWYHIALTIADNDSARLYVNGNKNNNGYLSFTTTVRPDSDGLFSMGQEWDTATSEFFIGAMDEVRVWNTARTETEIQDNMYNVLTGTEEGLAGYWRFDELEDGVTRDITANANHGTLHGGLENGWLKGSTWANNPDLYFTTADRGGFMTFKDADGDYIDAGSAIVLEDHFTISAWVNYNHNDNEGVIVGHNYNYILAYENGVEFIEFKSGDTWHQCAYRSTQPTNTWRHLTGTYNGDKLKLFENGIRVNTEQLGQLSLNTNSFHTELGWSKNWYDKWHFDGSMDEVTIWDRCLSAEEINDLMRGDINNYDNLQAYWKFNEGTGNYAYDEMESYPGTLEGSPKWEMIPLHKQLEVNEDETMTNTVMGYDLNGDLDLTYTLTHHPENGSMTIDASTGEISYTPSANYDGLDEFAYSISDPFGEEDSAVAFVKVNPMNDAPVILAEDYSIFPIGNTETVPSTGNHGKTVTEILEYNQVSDVDIQWYVDINTVEGIAVTYIENTDGYWKYCSNCADDYENAVWSEIEGGFGNHDIETNALLLRPNDRIAFEPESVTSDTTTLIKYRAWDMSEYSDIWRANASVNGGVTSFSSQEATVTQPIVQAFVLDVAGIDLTFMVPTDGSTSRRWELDDNLNLFGINFELASGGNDSLIIKLTQVSADSGKFEMWGAFDVELDDDPEDKFDVSVVLGNPENIMEEPGFLMTYKGSDGGATVYLKHIEMNICESLVYDGFTFETVDGTGEAGYIDFDYDVDESQFQMTGGATMDFDDVSLTIDFVDPADESPGLIIKDGTLEKLVMVTNGNISIKGLEFEDDGLSFEYLHNDDVYAMWGGLKITIDDSELDLGLHDEDDPGILFKNNVLHQLDVDVNSDFKAASFEFQTKDLDFRYVDEDGEEKYTVRGEADLQLTDGMEVTLTLGHDDMPGIDIIVDDDGTHFHLDEFEVEVQNLGLGTIDMKDAIFYYKNADGEQDFYVDLKVSFPPGYEVDGDATFEIVDGVFKMEEVSLAWCTVGDQPGIEIPGTGFELVEIGGELDHLDHPSNISFTGSIAASVAEQFSIGGHEVSVARIEGNVTIDKNHLEMHDRALLGAYADGDVDCTTPWESELAEADLDLYLGWARHYYYLNGSIDIPTDYGFRVSDKIWLKGSHLGMLGEVDVRVPQSIHLIGGKHIGSVDFAMLMKYGGGSLHHGSFLAAWERISLGWFGHLTAGFELKLSPFGFHFLGSGGVHHVEHEIHSDFGRDGNTTVSSSFDLEYSFATAIVAPLNWHSALDTVSLSVIGPTGSNFNFCLLDSVGVPTYTLTEEYVEDILNDSTAVVYISASVDSTDIIDLPLGTYTIDMQFNSAESIDSVLVLPMVYHRKPQIDISIVETHQDSVILNVDYWIAPHLLDSAKVNFYVDADTTHRGDGHLFGDGMFFENYDETTGWGSYPIIFTPGEHPTHNIAHSVFKPYYFYADITDNASEVKVSDYTEPTYMTPPIYGQVLDADSGFVPIPNMRVFIDVDEDGNYSANERYYDYGDDGLRDEDEPGFDADTNPDPNGDNVVTQDGQYNPLGTENNLMYDEGELYIDSDESGDFTDKLDIIDFTDEYGSFAFHGLPPGDYSVSLVIPHGRRLTEESPSKEPTIVHYNGNPTGLFFFITINEEEN